MFPTLSLCSGPALLWSYPAVPCRDVPCSAIPCPSLPCPSLSCPSLPCAALPCPAQLSSSGHITFHTEAWRGAASFRGRVSLPLPKRRRGVGRRRLDDESHNSCQTLMHSGFSFISGMSPDKFYCCLQDWALFASLSPQREQTGADYSPASRSLLSQESTPVQSQIICRSKHKTTTSFS